MFLIFNLGLYQTTKRPSFLVSKEWLFEFLQDKLPVCLIFIHLDSHWDVQREDADEC